MNAALATDWLRETLWLAIVTGSPVVLTILVIGTVLAVFQAATQINEQSVTFAAKALGGFVALTITGAWMLNQLREFTITAFEAMARVTGG
jgi:flagellar biosynthetic protein FliQ